MERERGIREGRQEEGKEWHGEEGIGGERHGRKRKRKETGVRGNGREKKTSKLVSEQGVRKPRLQAEREQ